MQTLDYLQRRVIHPAQQLQRQAHELGQLRQRMQRAFAYRKQHQNWQWQSLLQRLTAVSADFSRLQERHTRLAERLALAMRAIHGKQTGRVENAAQHLILLDPQQVLARGYSMVQDGNGRVVSDASQVEEGDPLRITFARGWGKVELKEKGYTS